MLFNNKVYIITGEQGSGKTTFLKTLVTQLQERKIIVGGFIAEGLWKVGKRSGFNLFSIRDTITIPLCTKEPVQTYFQLGKFYFNPVALKTGNKIIKKDYQVSDLMVIDEIGIFELKEQIWFDALKYLLKKTEKPVIITVRKKIVSVVIDKFALKNVTVFTCKDKVLEIAEVICENLALNKRI